MNVHVGRIARWQAIMGSFASEASPPPPLVASEDKDDDDDATASEDDDDNDDDDDDGDASSTDEMSTWHSYPLSLVTKMGSSFEYESSHS